MHAIFMFIIESWDKHTYALINIIPKKGSVSCRIIKIPLKKILETRIPTKISYSFSI
jgi:hypothetical protein